MFQSAYILHRYPYRETSFLLKVFTENEGLITLVAKNAKRPKSDWYALLQPFQKLAITYQGKGTVLTLRQAERAGPLIALAKRELWAGFYLNELLLKFLAPHDVHQVLFENYESAINTLNETNLEKTLRLFEMDLFDEMGLLPDFTMDEAGKALQADAWYQLEQHHLPRKIDMPMAAFPYHFQGAELIALRDRVFELPPQLKAGKRFIRLWLEYYGMGRDLHTREIFAEVFRE